MKIKTEELEGQALEFAVAKCQGINVGIISVEEQTARFMDGIGKEETEKYAKEYAEICASFKPSLCVIHTDGYRSQCDARYLKFSSDWAKGGPIIEREGIFVGPHGHHPNGIAWKGKARYNGPTPLIAAMRCYVASKLGDEVEIPEELNATPS